MQANQLSKADSKVLAQVFDPESGPAKAEILVDPDLPADRHVGDALLLVKLKTREKGAIRLIEEFERAGSRSDEIKSEVFRKALSILDRIVAEYPDYASAKNNRAQLRRWRYGDRNLICQPRDSMYPQRRAHATTAVHDLQQCIALASPERPQSPVSPTQGKLLAQAYTQLGALYHAASKDLEESGECEIVVDSCARWTKDQFEEEASRLFYLGGLYGNEVAKALAVHTNPHAKLCGSIVKEAMRKELVTR